MVLNKIAFCLASLVVILAFVFVASPATAQFEINLSVGTDEDISFADGNQVFYSGGNSVTIKIMSTKVINYHARATAATCCSCC